LLSSRAQLETGSAALGGDAALARLIVWSCLMQVCSGTLAKTDFACQQFFTELQLELQPAALGKSLGKLVKHRFLRSLTAAYRAVAM
jgi:hypothetical protein